jgi:large subunit ribosomal protein L6
LLKVTGPKGTLQQDLRPEIKLEISDSEIVLVRSSEDKQVRAYHGLSRALINNMVVGVTEGFVKTLKIVGVGWRASMKGTTLALQLGYSHPVEVEAPAGITFEVQDQDIIRVIGIDRQQVGQVAANIRKLRAPEPYKGKGVRYLNERIRMKVGKSGKK